MKQIYTIIKPFVLGIAIGGAIVLGSTLRGDDINTVRAFGDLAVQFGIPEETPLFSIMNMAPGDSVTKEVQVTNNGTESYFVAVKGIRTGPTEQEPPLIESVLQMTITEGTSILFQGTVEDFFSDSLNENGVPLSIVGSDEVATYTLLVEFPTSTGNEFQGKSVIFDLTFGTVSTDQTMVINEVYYLVAGDKGYDSPLDRGIDDLNKNTISVVISDNGAGSVNTVNVALKEVCKITQGNNVNISNAVDQNANTGNNTGSNIETGFIQQVLSFFNIGGINVASCGKKLGQNHEWIELYNTTEEKISLKNWTVTDNSGQSVKLKNKSVKPGQFVIITKDSATWKYWNENSDAIEMNLGMQFGDGLDNDGDHLYLRNAEGEIIDHVAWGNDTDIWDPAVPSVSLGSSIERDPAGFDTDTPSDWDEQTPPTPGY